MENKKQYLNEIVTVIETLACTNNPGPTAVKAAEHIDKHFQLIYRALDLPKVEVSTQSGMGKLSHITEHASGGDPKVMRELAFEYLAMADYIEAKKAKASDLLLRTKRFNAFKVLYPSTRQNLGSFDYEQDLTASERRAIDEIVRLKS